MNPYFTEWLARDRQARLIEAAELHRRGPAGGSRRWRRHRRSPVTDVTQGERR